ncbi:MAG: 50S ribosomal protein L5 [Candidatus Azambacteria bacterium]|nr:50S ribosomal protein L5 [Candidatus Azambacteria bacterium]
MNRLKEKYIKEVVPAMKKEFGYRNDAETPRIQKIVVNSGVGRVSGDQKAIESVERGLTLITGQKAILTLARTSIATFKLREGTPIGVKVTLRGERMYSFLDRLVSTALPRTRDFHGIGTKGIDQAGNLTIGIKEDIVFPEASHEKAGNIFGFEVTIVTNSGDRKAAEYMFRMMGVPLKK